MGVFQSLSVVALRQLVGGACTAVGAGAAADDVVKFLTNRFSDHSLKLTSALQTANDRAWKALEIALAGDSLWQRCTAAAEDRAFAQQVRAFLDVSPLRKVKAEQRPILDKALQELRSARKKSLLAAGPLAPAALAKEAGAFASFSDPQAVLDAEWTVLTQVASALRETCPNLHRVLLAKNINPPVLVVAVRYYFRREIETDMELSQGLAFAKLEALQASQDKGFAELNQALARQGERLEEMLAGISGVIVEIAETTKDTNARVRAMEQTIQRLLEQLQLQNREVRPSDSMSVRSEGERQLVKQLVAEYRALPEDKRRQLPGLLNNLGKLELAAGDFGEAQQKFQTVANMESDPKAKAEAHYNAYQAALQRQAWAEALASIKQAIALDAAPFAPFPEEYEPTRILGAGEFGVAFLCHHRFMNDDVVVKTLQTDELDANVDRVFTEAQALKKLDHRSIIRVSTCGYADPRGKARPYLAMDYFDGVNLETYVAEQGPLSPDELLGIAVPVAEALQAAHARGLLHRDVKPANILVRREGEAWRVKLIDFGLALRPSILEGQPSTARQQAQTTMGKTIAGTRHYAAPEQMGDLQAPVGSHSDVYGFGRSCYYALLGDPEPDDDDKESLPESWRSFLSGCTRKKTDKRVQDFAAVLAALAQLPKHACAVSGWLSWPEKGHERSERTSGTMTETRLSLQWQEVWPDGTWDGCLEGHSEDGVTFKGEYSYPPRDTKPRAFEFQKRVSGTEITLTGSWRKNAHESGEWHAKLKPTAEPPGKTGEEDWRTNHPVAFECARCYRELLANKYHRDVRVKFAKTVIPIYLRGRVRVAVWPRKNDQALITVERLSDAAVGEAVAYLTRHGIAVTPVKRPNNNMLRFDVSVQRLNEQRAAHEWIAEELLAVPPTGAGAGEDDELNDNGDGKAVSERVEILGHSATAVVRWMGKHGWDFNRAQAALHRLGSNIADSTIRIQLLAGARGERGAPAELTADQIAQLEA